MIDTWLSPKPNASIIEGQKWAFGQSINRSNVEPREYLLIKSDVRAGAL